MVESVVLMFNESTLVAANGDDVMDMYPMLACEFKPGAPNNRHNPVGYPGSCAGVS